MGGGGYTYGWSSSISSSRVSQQSYHYKPTKKSKEVSTSDQKLLEGTRKENIEDLVKEYIKLKNDNNITLLKDQYDIEINKFFSIIEKLIDSIKEKNPEQAEKLKESFVELKNSYAEMRKKRLEDINSFYEEKKKQPVLSMDGGAYQIQQNTRVELSMYIDWLDDTLRYFGLYKEEYEHMPDNNLDDVVVKNKKSTLWSNIINFFKSLFKRNDDTKVPKLERKNKKFIEAKYVIVDEPNENGNAKLSSSISDKAEIERSDRD